VAGELIFNDNVDDGEAQGRLWRKEWICKTTPELREIVSQYHETGCDNPNKEPNLDQ
jgi:hypothetical protein